MSTLPAVDSSPVTGKNDLVAWLAAGSKPKTAWRIGCEHEKFCFYLDSQAPVPYDGQRGIAALLEGLGRFGWKSIRENGNIIGLVRDGVTIALEPGGQVELSGAPLNDLHAVDRETGQHLAEIRQVAEPLGIGLLGLGFQPSATSSQLPWVPKNRYRIMRDFMTTTGSPLGSGLDMMQRTSSIQVNLDFSGESDMVAKMRVGMALQPLASALFAASPIVEGKPTAFKSWRMHIWEGTDPLRTGILPFVFEKDFGFERYTDYALDRPMYFLWRDGKHTNMQGLTFRAFLDGHADILPQEQPTLGDWADHLSTLFPDVRLRQYIELRSADCGPRPHLSALPALWTGLYYDQGALDQAGQLVREWKTADIIQLRHDAMRLGLAATIGGRTLQSVAHDVLAIAQKGLRHRDIRRDGGQDESRYLEPLLAIAESGQTVADAIQHAFVTDEHALAGLFTQYRL